MAFPFKLTTNLLIVSSVALIVSCTSSSQKQLQRLNGSTVSPSTLTRQIDSLRKAANVTGLSVTIFNEGKAVYSQAFGRVNAETSDSLRQDHIFYGASFSKAIFGYLVSELVAEGVLDLDKPLQQYLDKPLPAYVFEKEWKSYTPLAEDLRYEQITARMCLSHTTGFPNWRWISREFEFDPDGQIRFQHDPGTRYSYSGEGMYLLQFVLEEITGKGLEELAQDRIFTPLEMKMSSYVWQDRFENAYCNGHTVEGKVIPKDTEDDANAAGSLETTPQDYARFLEHIFRTYSANSPATQLLFEPNIQIRSKMQFGTKSWEDTTAWDAIKLSYGLGWGLLESPYGMGAFKEGHGEGFQHYSILFPESGIGVMLMSNSDNAESIFKYLLELTIADTFTPWQWENYVPFDLQD